jgi:hypothetical protein
MEEIKMRKTSSPIKSSERNSLRIVAAIALTGSLAAFGCSTNKMPGNGEPAMSAPAAGSVAPNVTSTPGSSSGATSTSGATPQAMTSSSPANGFSASEDAIATLKADEGFKGKYLGEAAPNDATTNTPASPQQVTGQFIPPSAYANPQVTLNSSISSAPRPAIVSGAGEGVGVDVTMAAPAATTADAMNATTSALTNTTATPITNTGIATARAAASNVTATPIVGALTNTAAATKSKATKSRATTTPSTSSVRIVSSNGAAVVTNSPPTAFQRFMSAIGLRRTPATTTPATTPATTSTQ